MAKIIRKQVNLVIMINLLPDNNFMVLSSIEYIVLKNMLRYNEYIIIHLYVHGKNRTDNFRNDKINNDINYFIVLHPVMIENKETHKVLTYCIYDGDDLIYIPEVLTGYEFISRFLYTDKLFIKPNNYKMCFKEYTKNDNLLASTVIYLPDKDWHDKIIKETLTLNNKVPTNFDNLIKRLNNKVFNEMEEEAVQYPILINDSEYTVSSSDEIFYILNSNNLLYKISKDRRIVYLYNDTIDIDFCYSTICEEKKYLIGVNFKGDKFILDENNFIELASECVGQKIKFSL